MKKTTLLAIFALFNLMAMAATPKGNTVSIIFNGNIVTVSNPLSSSGVTVTSNGADVTVNSTSSDVIYNVSGSSTNGSLLMTSSNDFSLILDGLTLTSTTKAAIDIESNVTVTLQVIGTATIADGTGGTQNGAFYCLGSLTSGTDFGTLIINGNTKHALSVAGDITLGKGALQVSSAGNDGIHASNLFVSRNASITIPSTGSDGIDCSQDVNITGGTIDITSTGEDVKGIKATNDILISGGTISVSVSGYNSKAISATHSMTVSGGTFNITTTAEEDKCFTSNGNITFSGGMAELNLSGANANGISSDRSVTIENTADITIVSSSVDGKCIKSDTTLTITGGNINITNTGDMSKGIKSGSSLNISGGTIVINAEGTTVVELDSQTNQNAAVYCTAIKSDGSIDISGGDITVTLPSSNGGGKGISADGDITISGGTFDIETNGDGTYYIVTGSTKDSYTSSCIKCNGNLSILAGHLTCNSTGAGGKGINCDGNMILGAQGASDSDLTMDVSTSGERFVVMSSSSGGWWGGEDNSDYANPKGIKSAGTMTINSGTINVYCSQSNEGGECIESKSYMTFNGGVINAYSAHDDAINASSVDDAATGLTINGGTIYAHSDNNDAIDSNGTLTINGGVIVSNGAGAPECGFDCDQYTFKITGGTLLGTGGDTSNPTTSVCTQPSLKITTSSNCAIQVLNSSGTVLVTYQCPTLSSNGGGSGPGGGPGGGSSSGSLILLLSHPGLVYGQTCTVKYGGSITGGTNWNGYYTGNVTYSGGSSKSVSINSYLVSVSASGSSSSSLPAVTTVEVTDITTTTAKGVGNVTSIGSSSVTARGICWSTSQNPTTSNSHATNGTGTGSFTVNMTGLNANTTYYARAYATNSTGTAYGSQISFTTAMAEPTITTPSVTTTAINDIAQTSAIGGGNVTSDGGAEVTARGICWSTGTNPSISDAHTTDGSGTGAFTSNMTGLTANTTYYVRAYATNSKGTSYGSKISFTTLEEETPAGLTGDVNVDEAVNISDVIMLLRYVMGGSTLTEQGMENADVNGDGSLNISDVITLLRMVMNS